MNPKECNVYCGSQRFLTGLRGIGLPFPSVINLLYCCALYWCGRQGFTSKLRPVYPHLLGRRSVCAVALETATFKIIMVICLRKPFLGSYSGARRYISANFSLFGVETFFTYDPYFVILDPVEQYESSVP